MAFGGFGPVHSLILWDEAVALQPKVVIEAFYAGNDLWDAFNLVYNWKQLPELRSPDPTLQAGIRKAEQSESIANRANKIHKTALEKPNVAVAEESTNTPQNGFIPKRLLSQHSKIYGLLRRAKYEFLYWVQKRNNSTRETWKREKAFAEAHPESYQIYDDGQLQTIFQSEYRLSVLNLGDPRIAEGLDISLKAIKKMHQLAASRNIRFLVVLVPTKETVFRDLWKHPSTSYRGLIENEERFWAITKDFFTSNGIEYLDSLPVLQKQLALGIQPYPDSPDGHPNEHGHMAIAKHVASRLRSP